MKIEITIHRDHDAIRARNRRNNARMVSMLRDAYLDDTEYEDFDASGLMGVLTNEFLRELNDSELRSEYEAANTIWSWHEYALHHLCNQVDDYIMESAYAKRYTRSERERALMAFWDWIYR